MTVDVSVACPAWDADLPDAAGIAERAVRAAATMLPRQPGDAEVSVLLADDALQRRLNRRWRGQDRATNVLAFPTGPLGDVPCPGTVRGLGDIVLAHGVVRREARRGGKSLADHLSHLVVHGFLHLLGFDHQEEVAAAEMEALEVRVLQSLGIADPYVPRRSASADRQAIEC